MKKEQWHKIRKWLALFLAVTLTVAAVPWSDLWVKAENPGKFNLRIQEEGGTGTISDIVLESMEEVTPEEGNTTPGEGEVSPGEGEGTAGIITNIPGNTKVRFKITPEEGKYLEKLTWKTETGEVLTTEEIKDSADGFYQVEKLVTQNMTLVCTYGKRTEQAELVSYFSVMAEDEGVLSLPYQKDQVYYAKSGYQIQPNAGILLKLEGESDYSGQPHHITREMDVTSFSVMREGDPDGEYERVFLAQGISLRIDRQAPEISEIIFSGEGNSESSWKETVTTGNYGYFFKEKTTVTVRANDAGSGLKSISYSLKAVEDSQKQEPIELTPKQDETGSYASFDIPANFKGRIYVNAVDYVGNDSGEKEPDGLIVEDGDEHGKQSGITIEVPDSQYKDPEDSPIFPQPGEGIQVPITVKDTYSGIKSVTWSVRTGEEEQTETIDIDIDGTVTGTEAEQWTVSQRDENLVTELGRTLTFTEDCSKISIRVSMTDRAGYEMAPITKTFGIDTKAPDVEVTCTPSGWTNEQKVRASFAAQDTEGGTGIAKVYYAKGTELSESVRKEASYLEGVYIADFTEESDTGAYVCQAVDYAGNVSEVKEFEIKIDRTVPEITEISFSGDGFSESNWRDNVTSTNYGYYFKERTTVTVRAHDTASGLKSISYSLKDSRELQKQEQVTLIPQKDDAGEYVTFEIPANFKGRVYVEATDNVENKSGEKEPDGLIVEDGTEHGKQSGITIELPVSDNQDEDGSPLYNKGETGDGVRIPVTVKDAYSGIRTVTWTIKMGEEAEVTKTIDIDSQGVITGSEAEEWKKIRTEENLVTEVKNTMVFARDCSRIQLSVSMTDRAGHELPAVTKYFGIDTQPPVLSVLCEPSDWTNEDKVDVTFFPEDTQGGTGISKVYCARGTSISEANRVEIEVKEGRYQMSYPMEEDAGVYVCQTVDRAGNVSDIQEYQVKIDRTAPKITNVSLKGAGAQDSRWEGPVEDERYGYYFRTDTDVTVTATDLFEGRNEFVSGVASITYRTVDVSGVEKEETLQVDAENQATFTVQANFKGRIYLSAADHTGNECAQVQPDGVILEDENQHKQSSHIQIELPDTEYQDAKGQKLYNHTVQIPVTVSDTYSGLREIIWTVESAQDSSKNQAGKLTVDALGRLAGDTSGWNREQTEQNLVTAVKNTITVSNNSNDITLKINATDRAGHKFAMEQTFSIDKTKPVIQVAYNKDEAPSSSMDRDYKEFYDQPRRAVITVKERNFDLETAERIVKKAVSGGAAQVTEWIAQDQKGGVSDEAEYRCVILYNGNNAYNFSMKVTDMAGNEKLYQTDGTSDIFLVDKKKPVLDESKFKIQASNQDTVKKYTDKAGITWYNQNVSFLFQSQDIGSGLYQVTTSGVTLNGTQGTFKKHIQDTYSLSDYHSGSTYFGKHGETQLKNYAVSTNTKRNKSEQYQLEVSAMDYAGNQDKMVSKQIGIDQEKPRITSISFQGVGNQDSTWRGNSAVSKTDYGYYFREAATVKITATDVNAKGSSGVKSISYCLEDINDTTKQEFKTKTPQMDEEEPYITFVIPERFKGQILVYATDYVGNQGDVEQPDGTVKEDSAQAKEANITIASPETSFQDAEGRPLYASDTTFHVTVEDIHSGLRNVEWSVESQEDSGSNQRGSVEIGNDKTLSSQDWKITRTDENLVTKLERDITVRNNSNDIRLRVKITDRAGNVTEYNEGNGLSFSIDKTEPKIEVSFDRNDPASQRYYNGDRVATITVTERNFDEEETNRQIQITNTDGSIPAYGSWSHGGAVGTDQATHTCTIAFAQDGDYTFTMTATDKARNSTAYGATDEFTIDKTNPVIDVSYTSDGLSNGIYYKNACVATITVTEHNFDSAGITITQTAELDGQTISAPVSAGWSSSGDVHTATIQYDTDGDFTLSVSGQDMATNPAENYTGTKFVVDLTEPEIEITDIEDMTAYNSTVAPGVTFSDVNCDADSVKIMLRGYKHDAQDLTGSLTASEHGGSVQLEDFAHTVDMDDVYTLTAQVTDLAGNSKEVSKVFSVNRFGSNYILDDGTQKLVNDYYSNQEEDLIIREVNVSSLETEGITYSRDGEVVTLERDKDYKVQEQGKEYASWKEYVYTVHADNFQEEGAYTVTVLSTDRAANSMTNRTAKTKEYTKEVEFVIDKTAPTSVISGVENQGQYMEAKHEVKIDSQDNVAIDVVEVYLNDKGVPVKTWNQKELLEQDGVMGYMLEAAPHWQNLRVVAVDKAGNRSESDTIRCLLTTNMLIQFYNNRPLFIGTIIALAAALAAVLLLVGKRRKKQQSET